jgi:hypothetical protein
MASRHAIRYLPHRHRDELRTTQTTRSIPDHGIPAVVHGNSIAHDDRWDATGCSQFSTDSPRLPRKWLNKSKRVFVSLCRPLHHRSGFFVREAGAFSFEIFPNSLGGFTAEPSQSANARIKTRGRPIRPVIGCERDDRYVLFAMEPLRSESTRLFVPSDSSTRAVR